MKAQARKILALIMAMVMSLSLAAPAFAAEAEEAPESSAPAAVEVEETEAPEKEEEEAKLDTQAKVTTPSNATTSDPRFEYDDETGAYTIYGATGTAAAAGNLKDTTQPNGVTVTLVSPAVDLIGQTPKAAEYEVVSTKTNASGTWTDIKVGKNTGAKKSVYDVADDDWKDLGNSRVFQSGNVRYQVKGSVYQESQGNGLVKTYFKLYKVENDVFQTEKDVVYLVNETARGAIGATDNDAMSDALKDAVTCDEYGQTGTGYNVAITNANLKVTIKAGSQEADVIEAYDFTVVNLVDLTNVETHKSTVAGTNTDIAGTLGPVTFATDKLSGTFQVSIEDKKQEYLNSKKGNTDKVFVTDVATAESIVKKQLTDVTVESVVAASGNYFTVTVSTTAASQKLVATVTSIGKNVAVYATSTDNGNMVGTAVLVDLSKDGFYNATSNNGANGVALAANTEVLGPVVVRESDVQRANAVPVTGVTPNSSGYYTFDSVAVMKKSFKAQNCKDLKPIPYAQVVVNPWNDTKQNKLVNPVSKSENAHAQYPATVITLANDWYSSAWNTPNADFVKKGEFEVEAVGHGAKYDVTEVTKAPTCKTPGSKIVRSICTICGNPVSEKTEEIPAITDPVETNTENEAALAIDGKQYKKIAFDDSVTTPTNVTKHYINKAKTETTVSADKTETVVTTTYTCNLGEVHSELTREIRVKKNNLQHSGRWNHFALEELTALEKYNNVTSDVPGYKAVTIVDSDVDFEALPMNRAQDGDLSETGSTYTGDIYFEFDVQKMSSSRLFTKADDNTWTATQALELTNVYATSKSLPATKYYAAKLTVKNLVKPQFACQTGSATFVAEVYDITEAVKGLATMTNLTSEIEGTKLENNLKDKKVTLLKTYTQDVVMKATQSHDFSTSTGGTTSVCRVCGEEKEVAPDLVITATAKDMVWTGKVVQPKITVKDKDGFTLIKNIDYVVSETEDTDVGTHYVTVKGVDAYAGNRINVAFNITQANQPMTLSATKKTISYKMAKTKKKKKTVYTDKGITKATSFTIKAKNAQGAVTWKSSNSKITVKAGKVTVKKGTKKGTYKITVKAAGNANCKAGSKTFKLTLKATK